jgi:P27 family predicted phage terminase small subunit
MRGPPPKPTAQLKLAGSWRAKTRKGEPIVAVAVPDPPPSISDDARKCWDELVAVIGPMRVLTTIDALALAQLAEYLARWRAATESIAKFGSVTIIKDDHGRVKGIKRSPYVQMQIEYGLMLRRMMSEFGMTPAARARITKQDETPQQSAMFSRNSATG